MGQNRVYAMTVKHLGQYQFNTMNEKHTPAVENIFRGTIHLRIVFLQQVARR